MKGGNVMASKKDLSEAGIKAKFITPAILRSGWDEQLQILSEEQNEIINSKKQAVLKEVFEG